MIVTCNDITILVNLDVECGGICIMLSIYNFGWRLVVILLMLAYE